MKNGHNVVVAVDPGFGGTGISMFIDGKLYKFSNVKSGKSDTERYADIASKCAKHVLAWLCDFSLAAYDAQDVLINSFSIVVESPHAMLGAAGRASLLRGDVFKVAKLAGAIGVVLQIYLENNTETAVEGEAPRICLYYPEVRAWKGNVKKDITQRRVLRDVEYATDYIKERHYKLREEYPDHIFDSVGIGLWFINKTIMGKL